MNEHLSNLGQEYSTFIKSFSFEQHVVAGKQRNDLGGLNNWKKYLWKQRLFQKQATQGWYNDYHGHQLSWNGNCSFWGVVKPGPCGQITEDAGEDGELPVQELREKRQRDFLWRAEVGHFHTTHTCPQISELISTFKSVSREAATQQCVSIPSHKP